VLNRVTKKYFGCQVTEVTDFLQRIEKEIEDEKTDVSTLDKVGNLSNSATIRDDYVHLLDLSIRNMVDSWTVIFVIIVTFS